MKNFYFLIVLLFSLQMNAQCWQTVSAGQHHTLAIKTDGTLWSWGRNTYGQLGDGTNTDKNIPTQVGSDNNWSSISAGGIDYLDFSLAIKTDGTLWAWGRNNEAQLGNGNYTSTNTPIQIGNSADWTSISAGGNFSIAIKTNGTLWTWGLNNYGQLGLGNISIIGKNSPFQIGTDNTWNKVELGDYFALAIKTNGTLWSWGRNEKGQLGDASTADKISPVQIGNNTNWQILSAGSSHSAAIKNDGTLWCWGRNAEGQLGDGTVVNKSYPIQIGSATTWRKISAGGYHNVAILSNGTAKSWGWNGSKQLGNGTGGNVNVPTQIGLFVPTWQNYWSSISAGFNFNIAITDFGKLRTFGRNDNGQLGDGTNIDQNSNIECTTLSLNENLKNIFFQIFPNPSNNIIYIQKNTNQPINYIEIIDSLGKKVFEKQGEIEYVDVQKLDSGIYFIRITSENKNYTTKFIKQ